MKLSPETLAELDDFQGWKSGNADFDLLDYVQCVATPDLLFGFLELLCPSLVQHDGHYFLASHFDVTTYDAWMAELHDPIAAQKVMNHIHISALFQRGDVSDEVACEAARHIAACWSRTFANIGLVGAAFGETFDDAEVTLYAGAATAQD